MGAFPAFNGSPTGRNQAGDVSPLAIFPRQENHPLLSAHQVAVKSALEQGPFRTGGASRCLSTHGKEGGRGASLLQAGSWVSALLPLFFPASSKGGDT